jgi:Tfp pilus assembly protein PilX
MTTLPANNKSNTQKGQALLIILLVLSVILTTALSVVSRSITDIQISTFEDTASRALTAAEAGVEEIFISGITDGTISDEFGDSDSAYETTISEAIISSDNTFKYPIGLVSGETATFWFVSHDQDGNLYCDTTSTDCYTGAQIEVCWGEEIGETPALELSIYYDQAQTWQSGNFDDIRVQRYAFDPDAARRPNNNFNSHAGGCSFGAGAYQYSTGLINMSFCPGFPPSEGCLIMARAKLFYNNQTHPVAIRALDTSFPAQGLVIDSVGTSGESTRKINVFQSYPEPPLIFDSSIFSSGSLVK